MALNQVIVVGGGLAGCTTAHTVLEHGGSVVVLDKSAFLGGNSTKATSGINATYTQAQADREVKDSVKNFENDINLSFHGGKSGPVHPIVRELARLSAPSIDWLVTKFGLDLSVLGLMGGHSAARTHRGKEKFPGMTITYALIEGLEKEAQSNPARCKIVTRARVTRLLRDPQSGHVVGVAYEQGGKEQELHGPVVLCTGGYGADFSSDSFLAKFRPDLMNLATTNGDHCTGDGVKMTAAIGGSLKDMKLVQVHPTGMVDKKEPNSKIKFLAAEALRGTGALILDGNGKRFCNELGRRDYVSEMMFKGKGPFRLVLNSKCASEIMWHCKHYTGRGLMEHFDSGAKLAKDIGIKPAELEATFKTYNECATKKSDPWGKKFFRNAPFEMKDTFYVATITPVIHYCMGGVEVNELTEVLEEKTGKPIPGLYSAGENAGGVHGVNRLGGNSLLDCVVFGRVAGEQVCRYLLDTRLGPNAAAAPAAGRLAVLAQQVPAAGAAAPAPAAKAAPTKQFTRDEVAKHSSEADCWVIIGKEVLDVTKFLADHPGGKKAIMLFAGKDATEEFDMLHKREVINKYFPEGVIGTLKE